MVFAPLFPSYPSPSIAAQMVALLGAIAMSLMYAVGGLLKYLQKNVYKLHAGSYLKLRI